MHKYEMFRIAFLWNSLLERSTRIFCHFFSIHSGFTAFQVSNYRNTHHVFCSPQSVQHKLKAQEEQRFYIHARLERTVVRDFNRMIDCGPRVQKWKEVKKVERVNLRELRESNGRIGWQAAPQTNKQKISDSGDKSVLKEMVQKERLG